MKSVYALLCFVMVVHAEVLKFQPQILEKLLGVQTATGSGLDTSWPPKFCNGLACPKYTVIKTTKDYELRQYSVSTWVSTNMPGIEYKEATSKEFRRLFNYISGENQKKEKIAMTAPVITMIIPGQGPACENNFTMSFFLTSNFTSPPAPTDSKVYIDHAKPFKAYVRSFPGYHMGSIDPWIKEAAKLAEAIGDKSLYHTSFYFTAGYDSPFRFFNRHNEVWFITM